MLRRLGEKIAVLVGASEYRRRRLEVVGATVEDVPASDAVRVTIGAGSPAWNELAVAGDRTVLAAEVTGLGALVVVSGAGTVTLPEASTVRGRVVVVKRGAGAVAVAAAEGQTVDGAASFDLQANGDAVACVAPAAGSDWRII